MSSSGPSHASSSSETPNRVGASRRDSSACHNTPASFNSGHDPAISQATTTTTTPQTHRPRPVPRPGHASADLTEDSLNPRKTTCVHSATSSSSRSRSSSRAGSSTSTTFSEATASGLSAPSSPATSFCTPPSPGSTRDSGYSSGGSEGDPEADREQKKHLHGNSRYLQSSCETRHGGYDFMQERIRSRRERRR